MRFDEQAFAVGGQGKFLTTNLKKKREKKEEKERAQRARTEEEEGFSFVRD